MNKLPEDDIEFLLLLIPDWAREAPEGLDPTFYGTGSQASDQIVVDRVKAIKKKQALKTFAAEEEPESFEETKTVVPKWFYKLVFVVCSKLAKWAMDKAGIKPDQHKKAEEGTDKIKNASDKIEDTPVDIEDRDPDDIFDNTDFNS